MSKNTALWFFGVEQNQLTVLDVSKNTAMEQFDCSSNQLTVLDVSKNVALEYLYCSGNQLTDIDISKNAALKYLYCGWNLLSSLDLSKSISSETISCSDNRLASLDVSKCMALTELSCYRNQIKGTNMDALITSLPINSGAEPYKFYVVEYPFKETNVCTVSQVAAAKSKGWQAYYYNAFSGWTDYEGSDDVILVTIITINNSSLTLQTGQSEVLTATVKPDNATDKSVSWSSDNTSVATIDSNGKVTAKGEGNATITCKANDGSGVSATCIITVSGGEKWGDVNGDDVVDVADIASIISVMAGQSDTTLEKAADVNGDGTVDVADIAAVITRMAELARQQQTIAEKERF